MYNYMQPPMGPYMPWFPPLPQPPTGNNNPAEIITGWIRSLEDLKKAFKEEKKDDDKKKKQEAPGFLATSLFMLLISPITGPVMYHFFQLSVSLINK